MLSPVTGHPLHTRTLSMALTLDASGKWRAKGDIIDLRKTGFAPMSTSLQPAGIIHHMCLELLIDPLTMTVDSLLATQPVVAIEPSIRSCGESCRDPVKRLDALLGEELDALFSKKLSQAFAGPRGCSHLLTLFHFMTSSTLRALNAVNGGPEIAVKNRSVGECAFHSSLFLDGFMNEAHNIELSAQLSDYSICPESAINTPLDRMAFDNCLRLFTEVQAGDMLMKKLHIAERQRTRTTLGNTPWRAQDEWVAGLSDAVIVPGLASRSAKFCGQATDKQLLLETLLQLAPGYIQVMAALADQWVASVEAGESGESTRPIGGMTDSCYMWRSNGPLHKEEETWPKPD